MFKTNNRIVIISRICLVFLFTLSLSNAFGQVDSSCNKLDTAEVIRIAKRKNSYWTQSWQAPPSIQYKEETCEWVVQSHKYTSSLKGECKHTNGCTIVSSVNLVINAKNGKIKSKRKEKTIYHNYE
ncbi:MAG: hypothetical protein CFE21_01070 [Bacteroidetes bacterium B1(2017)]|nr:MAG: hypothetical protein CFE21_01070 [Bacteroidetes bacterium B1(2017)]